MCDVYLINSKNVYSLFRILLKKSGSRMPRIELEEIGPSLDLVLRRTKLASEDLYRKAIKKPKQAKVIVVLQYIKVSLYLLDLS